ncbi:hypothetical protein [Streptomyces fradiae]|uniref:hypothetical protein n=1 Tax=Streptomyces fradiae TaxID=1906 RepID=UPI003987D5D4
MFLNGGLILRAFLCPAGLGSGGIQASSSDAIREEVEFTVVSFYALRAFSSGGIGDTKTGEDTKSPDGFFTLRGPSCLRNPDEELFGGTDFKKLLLCPAGLLFRRNITFTFGLAEAICFHPCAPSVPAESFDTAIERALDLGSKFPGPTVFGFGGIPRHGQGP